jgi:hypothetical protein
LLFVGVFAVLAWIFIVPSCSTKFGCAAAGAVAYADSGSCPSNINAAAGDASWATDRLASIANQPQTAGLFYDKDGNERDFVSDQDSDEDTATQVMRDLGIVPANATLNVAAHVEIKAAAMMHQQGLDQGLLVINRTTGICNDGPYTCAQVVPKILPNGVVLVIWSPKEIANGEPATFKGGGS